MAELAAGAVSSLLGVLRNEAQLLRRMGHDVEFIKEEMESMNSFLEHLARTAPPGGSHDEQVQTWMRQVRYLAHDCSNCIDHYLQHGDPAIHRARGGLRGYLWWASWFVQELIAQHKAAIRLRELKERASDVGKRRLRYGVEIPGKGMAQGPAATSGPLMLPSTSSSQAVAATPATEDHDEDEEDRRQAAEEAAGLYFVHRQPPPEFPTLGDYFLEKIAKWVEDTKKEKSLASIAIVALDNTGMASTIAHEALTKAHAQFKHTVWINLRSMHYKYDKLGINRVLCYILLVCQHEEDKKKENYVEKEISKFSAWKHKRATKREIMNQTEAMVHVKIEELNRKIKDMEITVNKKTGGVKTAREVDGSSNNEATGGGDKTEETGESNKMEQPAGQENKADQTDGVNKATENEGSLVETDKPIGVLYLALLSDEKERNQAKDVLATDDENIVKETAKKLEQHMKGGADIPPIRLDVTQYEGILQELFLTSKTKETEEATTATRSRAAPATMGNDQIKEIREQIKDIVLMVKQDILENIQSSKPQGPGGQGPGREQVTSAIEGTKNKITQIEMKIKKQMIIKGIVDKINTFLKGDTLIVLEDENRTRGSKWEDIINALKLLECSNKGSAVIVTTKNSHKGKEFCNPLREPITYSLVYLYHDIVLQSTKQRMNNQGDKSQIIHDILDKCHPNEFCMKMFARALYANPNSSKKELGRLCDALQASGNSLATNAKKIFKFSYRNLPREHKTCLLYLAVFPPGHIIRRSILIGRWLTEGLITKEDWSTAVRHAEGCFDALIDRCLVCPCDISAKGEFKSCMVGDPVHGFITKMAKKQHILDARLSHLWAHHFSIFSGLRLRASDSIELFVKKLHDYAPQLSLLKLLDLQGCQCFDKNGNLKAICNNIPFLKYLSLRETNVMHLPSEINNLHDLEILDIRQTKVTEKETRHIRLLKLRRLLAGGTDPSLGRSGGIATTNKKERSLCSCVRIPDKIEKMENIEVLSNVMASTHGNELKEIGKLWQLRKLGVVIKDNDRDLQNLLQVIVDLKECIQSLSITIPDTGNRRNESTIDPDKNLLVYETYSLLVQPPKTLESLSINGHTNRIELLSVLAKGSNELAKVSLCGNMIIREHLKALAELPKLSCIRLRHNAYIETRLIFDKEEFEHLKYLLVDGENMTDITFKEGAAVELEKIVLSSTNVKFLCGAGRLAKLKGLELKDNESFVSFSEDKGGLQGNTDPVSLSKDGAAPEKPTEHISPSKDIATPHKSIDHVSSSKDGADPQKSTKHVSSSVDRAAPLESPEHISPSEDGANTQETERQIIFEKGEFQHLKYFLFQDHKTINITFKDGAVPELDKIILSLVTSAKSQLIISGSLPKLKEIELKGDKSTFLSLCENANKIDKVTLCDTLLNKDDLGLLAKKRNICSLVLLENSYDESQLTFRNDDFPKLNLLVVKCSKIKNISFDNGTAPNLEKIIWSFTELESLSGIDKLGKLKEVDLDGDPIPRWVRKDIKEHKNKPVLVPHKKPQHQVQAKGKEQGAESWFRRVSTSCFSMEDQH